MKPCFKARVLSLLIMVFCINLFSFYTSSKSLKQREASACPFNTIALLPLTNLTECAEALEKVEPILVTSLSEKGFQILENGRLEEFLVKKRIRYTDSLQTNMAMELSASLKVRLIMSGSIFSYSNNKTPQIGLNLRLIDGMTGSIVWCGASCMTGEDRPGFLNLGKIETLEEMIGKVIDWLLSSLRVDQEERSLIIQGRGRGGRDKFLAPEPFSFKKRNIDLGQYHRMAVLPFSNLSKYPNAGIIVHDYFLANLFSSTEAIIVGPAEVRRVLIEGKVRNASYLTWEILQLLRLELGVDGVISGTVYTFKEGINGHLHGEPEVEISVKMVDTTSGEIVWAARQQRKGGDSIFIYDMGRVRNAASLAGDAVANVLSTLVQK